LNDKGKLSQDFFLRKSLEHKVVVGLFETSIAHETYSSFHQRVISAAKIARRQLLMGNFRERERERERETIFLYILKPLLKSLIQGIILY